MEDLIIGSHVSFNKNSELLGSVEEALSYNANTFMFYTGAPQNTTRLPLHDNFTKEALELMKNNNIDINNVVVHAPYIINLANKNNLDFSISFLKQELKRVKELGVKKVTVRIDETKYENLLKRVGADAVIVPEEDAGIELAKKVVSDSILDYYQVDKEYGVVQIAIPNNFKEQSLIELDVRNKFDVNIVGVIRSKSFFIPKGQDKVLPNDVIMVVGKSNKIIKFDNYINK